ncbi:uncharacterized protein LOC131877088 isoform X4 [Tigriopus californicus]|uniref:uncharacterized protein LOC131877088 isoform X4 n=1 Tax=Tigriopus californicus TaxID=6832 RepID=UPI0027DA9B06|nr:uncharacterized protein LOC131877088 isoform X4 [Tigriopus californicus]
MEEIKHSYEWPDEVSVTPLSLKRVSTENYAPNIIVNDILDDCIEQVCYQRAPILTPNPAHVDRSVSVEVLTSMPMVEELRDWVHPKRRFSDLDEDSIANDSLIKDRRDTVNAFSDASHCSENDLMECHSPSDRRTDSSAVSILSDKELELAPFKDTMSEGNEFRGEISAFGRSCEGSSLVNGDSRSSVEYPQIEEGLLFSDLESCDSGIKYSKYWSIAKSARKSVMNWRPNNWPEILSDESSSRMKNSIQSSETQQNIIASRQVASTSMSPEGLIQDPSLSVETTVTPVMSDLCFSTTPTDQKLGSSPCSDQYTSRHQYTGLKNRAVQSCPMLQNQATSFPNSPLIPITPTLKMSPPRSSGRRLPTPPMIKTPLRTAAIPINTSQMTPKDTLMIPYARTPIYQEGLAKNRRVSPKCLPPVRDRPSFMLQYRDPGFPGWNFLPPTLKQVSLGQEHLAKSPCTRVILQKNPRMTEMTCWNGALKMFKIMRE